MTKKFLDSVYKLDSSKDVEEFYDDWASTYDAEVGDNGYATPGRCAAALKQYLPNMSASILDVGCGTGLSGEALSAAGFQNIDGIDPSAEMLELARGKNVYRTIIHMQDDQMPTFPEPYDAIACIGVIGSGAAPLALLDTVVDLLPVGGKFVLSFNDKTIAEGIYEDRLNALIEQKSLTLQFREYGDHLPGKNMKSFVYVLEKN